jgi:hypothetical protein
LGLLGRSLGASLQRNWLDTLSARVPYGPDLVTPGLRAIAATKLRHLIPGQGTVYLEVVLHGAWLDGIAGPVLPPSGASTTGGSMTTMARRANRRPPARAASRAAAGAAPRGDRRLVTDRTRGSADLGWTLDVNLFVPRAVAPPTTATTGGTGAGTGGGGIGAGAFSPGTGPLSAIGDFSLTPTNVLPDGDRITLASGTARMRAPTDVVVSDPTLQFWLAIDFTGVRATYASDDPALAEFLATDGATSLLAQAVAPLLNASSVPLSPRIAPAGSVPAVRVLALQLPPLRVHQLVLPDDAGAVLTLCGSLGAGSEGSDALVRTFLGGHDFAWYVSDKLFGPALTLLWQANAIRVPIVADVPVEMPVSSDSDETGEGLARVQSQLGDTLTRSSVEASDNAFGDPLQLESEQTVQLLRLWDPNGQEITDLGDYGKPATVPFVIRLLMFDMPPAGSKQELQPTATAFLKALLRPMYVPMLESPPLWRVDGFSSCALRCMVARWSLQRPRPGGEDVATGGALVNAMG